MQDLASKGDAVITVDPDGKITSLNPVAEFLTGWALSDAMNVPLDLIFKIVHPETRETIENPTIRALRDDVNAGLPYHTLLLSKDGSEHSIGPCDHSAIPIRNSAGELTGGVLMFRDVSHLHVQERIVRTALAYADNIIETLREPFLVLENTLLVKTANKAFYKMFRVAKDETEGCSVFELGSGQWDTAAMRSLLNSVLMNHETVQDFDIEIDFPSMGRKIMRLNARCFGPVESRPDLILLAFEDVTERQRAENDLRQSEQRQRLVLDSIPQKIATTKPSGEVDYFNPQWTEYTGLSYEEIRDWGWKQFIHPDDLDEHSEAWMHSIRTGDPFSHESRFRRKDGEYRWHVSRAVPVRDDTGQVQMWIGSNPDIHDIRLAEMALHESEVRYRRLFETAKDGVLILDTITGEITDANPYMSSLLEYSHTHFIGKQLWEIGLFSDKAQNESAVRTLQTVGYIRYEHLPLETQSGQRVEVEIVANAYQQGLRSVIQCNIRDITERSRLEKQLKDQTTALADLHRRKDEFLAMLGHELRNPLAPITNAVQLLSLQKHEDKLQRQARTIIERQVGQLTRLIDDLLEVSRITSGIIHLQKERTGLNGIVERALETTRPLMDQCRHDLTVTLSPQPIWLYVDAARLEQVIVNLLTNAAKYTADGGKIALTLLQQGDDAIIRVRDSGVGIPPELLPRIFDLFTQAERSLDRAQGGLGIGLCLVQRLVEMHGGRVEVSSIISQGSEFIVYLPVVPVPVSLQEPILRNIVPSHSKSIRVVVVDDNVDSAQSLGLLLQALGHEVRTAYDGPTAISLAVAFRPNIMFLDIGLPQLDGYQVARRLKQHSDLDETVLVAMTGYGQESDKLRSLEAGFHHHLVKPADFDRIQEILAKVSLTAQ